jgi:hypothetical protein
MINRGIAQVATELTPQVTFAFVKVERCQRLQKREIRSGSCESLTTGRGLAIGASVVQLLGSEVDGWG